VYKRQGLDGGVDRKVSRADYDLVAVVVLDEREENAEEVASVVRRFMHFPVGGDEFLSHEGPFLRWDIARLYIPTAWI